MNRLQKFVAQGCSCSALILAAALLGATVAPAVDGAASPPPDATASPFANLAGWWGGRGRIRFTDGKTEDVRCRATYFVEGEGKALRQNIRCASQSGKIELKSAVRHADGAISGEWSEDVYNVRGSLDGSVTPHGFRVGVQSTDGGTLSANMDIIVKDTRQMVEIQFFSETLVGLTLLLEKG